MANVYRFRSFAICAVLTLGGCLFDEPRQNAPTAQTSGAQQAQARGHYERGRNLFAQQQYLEAIEAFAAADALWPAPALDYNIGLAYERLGDTENAIYHYQRYLQREPNAANRAEVSQAIQRLQGSRGAVTVEPQDAGGGAVTVEADGSNSGRLPNEYLELEPEDKRDGRGVKEKWMELEPEDKRDSRGVKEKWMELEPQDNP